MSDRRISAISCLVVIGLTSCANRALETPATGPESAPSPPSVTADIESRAMSNDLQSIVDAARKDAVSRVGVPANAITVQSALRVTWRDGSLGCPEPGVQYTQALVPGWRVILRAGDQTLDYHAAANGHLILCPRERAIEPAADESA
jgi:hypothetical protein